jgi:hypothetical protein
MRELVRSTVLNKSASSLTPVASSSASSPQPLLEKSPAPSFADAASVFAAADGDASGSNSRRRSPSPESDSVATSGVPVAVLSCVTVPAMPHRRSPVQQQTRNTDAVVPPPMTSLSAPASSAAQNRRASFAGSTTSIRTQPIRPFLPVANQWSGGAAYGDSPNSGARPVVERYDLLFDVTPANDFKNLPFALTGLAFPIPYMELQDELSDLIEHAAKLRK